MRKFLVYFRKHLVYGEYEYYTKEIVLNTSEKANVETFENKLNELNWVCGEEKYCLGV